MDTAQQIRTTAPASEPEVPRQTTAERVWHYLDSPVGTSLSAIAQATLPNWRQSGLASSATAPEPEAAASRNGSVIRKTFAPILTEHVLSDRRTALSHADAEKHSDISLVRCIKESLGWAWRAGKGYMIAGLATSAAASLLPYALSFSGANVIDSLINLTANPAAAGTAYLWFGVSAVGSLAMFAVNAIDRYVSSRHEMAKKEVVNTDMRRALTGFSPAEQTSPEVSQLVNRTLQSQWAMQSFGSEVFRLVIPVISVVGAITIVAPYSPLGACLLGLFVVPYLYHSHKRGIDELTLSDLLSEPESKLGGRSWGLLTGTGHTDIRLHGKMEELLEHLGDEEHKFNTVKLSPELAQQKRENWVQPLNIAAITGIGFVILSDVAAGAASHISGAPSIGQYGLVMGALYSLNSSIRSLASGIGSLLKNFPQAQLAHSVMQQGLNRQRAPEKPNSVQFETGPAVSIKGLRFAYPPTDGQPPREVLHGLTVDIRPGELLAVVGRSGCGKSSLVNILCGVHDPSAGLVSFDGIDAATIRKDSLWACSGYLRQTSGNFYSMTFRENIAIGSPHPLSDEEIMAIAEETGFAAVMRECEITLDTTYGQWFRGGKNLSGGQGARLALTRQAASRGKFLVLDEPTSGLDQEAADLVIDRIRGLTGVTRVLIAHDYGVAARADRILVLDAGDVVDCGSHDELMDRCELYRDAFTRQSRRLQMLNSFEE